MYLTKNCDFVASWSRVYNTVSYPFSQDAAGICCWDSQVVLAMIADTAERYLSTPLFSQVSASMNEALGSDKMTGSSWQFDKPIFASFKAALRRKAQFQNLPRAISILAYLLAKCKDLARHVSHNRLRQPKFQLEDYIAAIAQSSAKDAR
jgi:hypothetical protein